MCFTIRVCIDEGADREYTTLQQENVQVAANSRVDVLLAAQLKLPQPAREPSVFNVRSLDIILL